MTEFAVLPDLKCTEDAVAFGLNLSTRQYIFLSGAHAALEREFHQAGEDAQRRVNLATKIQLYREAMEAAPQLTLSGLLAE